jgi:hypothetical protein
MLTDARLEEIRRRLKDPAAWYRRRTNGWSQSVDDASALLAEITRTRPLIAAAEHFAAVDGNGGSITGEDVRATDALLAAARALSSPTPGEETKP